MQYTRTDNTRITGKRALIPANVFLEELPLDEKAAHTVVQAREGISAALNGSDDRPVVVVGPCSIHDTEAALDYGQKLARAAGHYRNELLVVMRVYFEKPRTTVGWKGLINDPDLDGSFNINKGLREARSLLLELNRLGLPCGTEYLDVISPQYIADLVSWGAIGARTTESQVHRELASGLSCPVGFKNATDGNTQVAVDAIYSARAPHQFLSMTKEGTVAIFGTQGNTDTHMILRGGKDGTNYDTESISQASTALAEAGVPARVMVDCSHGNSLKNHKNQPAVCRELARQIANGSTSLFGLMLESHLKEGKQSINQAPLTYGQSITDACIDWPRTEALLEELAGAVRERRCRLDTFSTRAEPH